MTEREAVRTESGWLVWCSECHTRFESKRSDACYCSPTCRSRVFRREKKREETISLMKVYVDQVRGNMPRRGRSLEFEALAKLQVQIANALASVEND